MLTWLFLRVPSHEAEQLSAGTFKWKVMRRVLGNLDFWLAGLLGGDPHRLRLILTPEEMAKVTFIFMQGDITDLSALTAVIGLLPQTPLRQEVVETIALFRQRIAGGQLNMDALLH